MGKRMECSSPRTARDGKTWWHRVGSAWINDEGLTTIYLDSYPLPDKDGVVKFSLFEPKPREGATTQERATQARGTARGAPQQQPLAEELDDDIPF